MEVLAISTLLLLVIAEFSPGVSILLFSGVFIAQTVLNVFNNHTCCNSKQDVSATCCSISSKLLAFVLQSLGLFGLVGYLMYQGVVLGAAVEYRAVIGLPLAILLLSVVWSNRCQEYIARSHNGQVSARYKSSKTQNNHLHEGAPQGVCLLLQKTQLSFARSSLPFQFA